MNSDTNDRSFDDTPDTKSRGKQNKKEKKKKQKQEKRIIIITNNNEEKTEKEKQREKQKKKIRTNCRLGRGEGGGVFGRLHCLFERKCCRFKRDETNAGPHVLRQIAFDA